MTVFREVNSEVLFFTIGRRYLFKDIFFLLLEDFFYELPPFRNQFLNTAQVALGQYVS